MRAIDPRVGRSGVGVGVGNSIKADIDPWSAAVHAVELLPHALQVSQLLLRWHFDKEILGINRPAPADLRVVLGHQADLGFVSVDAPAEVGDVYFDDLLC